MDGDTVTKVVGAKDHPFTRGFLCAKVNDCETRTYAPDRLLHPLRRSGANGSGTFERISWDEAINEIADRFENVISANGAEASMPLHDAVSAGVLQRRGTLVRRHAASAKSNRLTVSTGRNKAILG